MKSRYLYQTTNFFRPTGFIQGHHLPRSASSWAQILGVAEAASAIQVRQAFQERVEKIATSSLSSTAASQQYDVLRSAYDAADFMVKKEGESERLRRAFENDFAFIFELHTVHVNSSSRDNHDIRCYHYSYKSQEEQRNVICKRLKELGYDVKPDLTSHFNVKVSGNLYALSSELKEFADVRRQNINDCYTF